MCALLKVVSHDVALFQLSLSVIISSAPHQAPNETTVMGGPSPGWVISDLTAPIRSNWNELNQVISSATVIKFSGRGVIGHRVARRKRGGMAKKERKKKCLVAATTYVSNPVWKAAQRMLADTLARRRFGWETPQTPADSLPGRQARSYTGRTRGVFTQESEALWIPCKFATLSVQSEQPATRFL